MTRLDDLAASLESDGFEFLRWADWFPGGRPDLHWTKLFVQGFPAQRHWVHHSVTSASSSPRRAANDINDIGIARFGKMSYPFLIHASGTIIQGCYPYIGAHTMGYNSTSLAGCNIGNYDQLVPPQRMIDANIALIAALRDTGHYPPRDIAIYGHQQSPNAQTACPGKYLMARLPDIRREVNTPTPVPEPPPLNSSTLGDTNMVIRRIENPNQSVLIVPDKTSPIGVRGFLASVKKDANGDPVKGEEGITGTEEIKVDKGAWRAIVDDWLAKNGALVST